MKKYILISVILLSSKILFPQNWQWAKHVGSTGILGIERISSFFSVGNDFYMVGIFNDNLYFPTDTIYSYGYEDIFISKFDSAGNLLWAKTIGGGNSNLMYSEYADCVYDSLSNSIYFAGRFYEEIYFGNGISLSANFTDENLFIARMNLDGTFLWANKITGNGNKSGAHVFSNNKNKIYLVTASDESLTFNNFQLGPGGYIAQYDTSGNCLSAQLKFTNLIPPYFNRVAIKFIGPDLILYGVYYNSSFQIDTAHLVNHGGYDCFIARADSNANIKWIKSYGYSGNDYITGLELDNSNNMYIAGSFKDSINLGNGNLYNLNYDFYLAKLDSNGNVVWNKQSFITGTNSSFNYLLSDGNGYSYLTGFFTDTAHFDNFTVTASGNDNMFLARYNPNGLCLGVKNFGNAHGFEIASYNNGNVINAGIFSGTVSIGNTSMTSYRGYDIYIAKLDAITGVENVERVANNSLLIYANPNQGKCNITIPDEFNNEKILVLSIFDNTGKLIQQNKLNINDGTIKLSLEAEAKGIYNVSLSNGKRSYSGKIVFE